MSDHFDAHSIPLKVFGQHDDRTLNQLKRCAVAEPGAPAVLCADGHLGYSMPIGGVVGYRRYVSPSGVGYDIACGNLAVKTNLLSSSFKQRDLEGVANAISSEISFGVGRKNNTPVDSPVFDAIARSPVAEQRSLLGLAKSQLGTVGSGNHYVDILEDENGSLWIAVHFGSRGFGHKTAKGFMNIAQGRDFDDGKGEGEMDSPPLLLSTDKPSGQDYIEAMKIAGDYAYRGREEVVRRVMAILGAKPLDSVHNHHNFAWLENHGSQPLWVVRKGATPAFPGQVGFVGGSMGDISVIVRGVDSPESRQALYSTVHGAGRVMSRTQAAGKQKWIKGGWKCGQRNCSDFDIVYPYGTKFQRGTNHERPLCEVCGAKMVEQPRRVERTTSGLVNFEEEKEKLTKLGIVIRGAGADEAPPVYRKLESVIEAHRGTIEVLHTLYPRVVVMAGADVFDPYKD